MARPSIRPSADVPTDTGVQASVFNGPGSAGEVKMVCFGPGGHACVRGARSITPMGQGLRVSFVDDGREDVLGDIQPRQSVDVPPGLDVTCHNDDGRTLVCIVVG